MNAGKVLFAQLMDFLPWTSFSRCVTRYGGDRRVRNLSCAEQYRAMAFVQLSLSEQGPMLCLIRVPSMRVLKRLPISPSNCGTSFLPRKVAMLSGLTVWIAVRLRFQIIRRTIATLSQTKGHAKATQGMMRHSRVATTTYAYQQVIPEGVAEMVDSIHGELRKPSTAAAETSRIASKLRAGMKPRSVQKSAKLAPIGAKMVN